MRTLMSVWSQVWEDAPYAKAEAHWPEAPVQIPWTVEEKKKTTKKRMTAAEEDGEKKRLTETSTAEAPATYETTTIPPVESTTATSPQGSPTGRKEAPKKCEEISSIDDAERVHLSNRQPDESDLSETGQDRPCYCTPDGKRVKM